jgi:hypothetical protein
VALDHENVVAAYTFPRLTALDGANEIITSCWIYPLDNSSGYYGYVGQMSADGLNGHALFSWLGNSTIIGMQWSNNSTSSYFINDANTNGGLPINQWNHLLTHFRLQQDWGGPGVHLLIGDWYINGVHNKQDASNVLGFNIGVTDQPFEIGIAKQRVAEIAWWISYSYGGSLWLPLNDITETTKRIAPLAAGASPLVMPKTGLATYIPLVRDRIDIVRGVTGTPVGSNPATIEHPRVWMPRRRVVVPAPASGRVPNQIVMPARQAVQRSATW